MLSIWFINNISMNTQLESAQREFSILSSSVPTCRTIRGKYFPLFDLIGVTKTNNKLCPLVTNLFILDQNKTYVGYLPALCEKFTIRTSYNKIFFYFPDINIDSRNLYTGMIITDINGRNISACIVYIFDKKDIDTFSPSRRRYLNYLGINKYGIMRNYIDIIELPYLTEKDHYVFEEKWLPNIGLIDSSYRCYIPLLFPKFVIITVEDNMMKVGSSFFSHIQKTVGVIITDIYDNVVIATRCILIEKGVDDDITDEC